MTRPCELCVDTAAYFGPSTDVNTATEVRRDVPRKDGTIAQVTHLCEECAELIDENRQAQEDMASGPSRWRGTE